MFYCEIVETSDPECKPSPLLPPTTITTNTTNTTSVTIQANYMYSEKPSRSRHFHYRNAEANILPIA